MKITNINFKINLEFEKIGTIKDVGVDFGKSGVSVYKHDYIPPIKIDGLINPTIIPGIRLNGVMDFTKLKPFFMLFLDPNEDDYRKFVVLFILKKFEKEKNKMIKKFYDYFLSRIETKTKEM